MNTLKSLQSAARHNRSKLGLKEAARQMGLDVSKLTSDPDAKAIWDHLNELAENDPQAYQAFIQKQQREVSLEESRKDQLVPVPGFTVKSFLPSQKLFINCCSHERVQPPVDAAGKSVDVSKDVLVNTSGMTIPMVVGKLREMKDHEGKKAKVVDTIFNPWVIGQATGVDKVFKSQVTELAIQMVNEEFGFSVPVRRYKLIRSQYKGGRLVDGRVRVVPHRLSEVDEDVENLLENPANVLKQLRKKEESEEAETRHLELPQTRTQSSGGKTYAGTNNMPMIEELGKRSGNANGKKKKPAVKKGFLNNECVNLYPEGSNEGAAKSLFQKCKIVDLSKMDEASTKQAMMEHAQGGNELRSNKPMQERSTTTRVTRDAFDDLVEQADPEMRSSSISKETPIPTDKIFNELSKSLSMMPGFLKEPPSEAPERKERVEEEPQMRVEKDGGRVTIRVDLPECEDLKDVKVDISQRRMKLHLKGIYKLDRMIGALIDDTSIQAKFSKKRKQLVVKADVRQG